MPLKSGRHIGPYRVVAVIGAGGMGEVYRATDTQLGRDVALKVLPERFASDPERLARFEREARVLASLNHPNIAAIHGVAESEGTRALVLELVEGETLADRIARGPVSVDAALLIAQQMAEALDAAHELGIIHRDLKPANVKITGDSKVKVLDFGLAKLAHAALDSSLATASSTATLTPLLITDPGKTLGTSAYMSPEQARGLPVDRRTDIWAFGCVLYEMLTGQRAFAGTTTADVIAGILEREIDLRLLPARTPYAVRRLLRRCLTKAPRDRLRDIGDARLEIEEAKLPVAEAAVASPLAGRWRWLAVGALIGAVISGATAWRSCRSDPTVSRPVVRFTVASDAAFSSGLAISSDGARLAYRSPRGVVVRVRDRLESIVLEGLGTFPGNPFFSPDGEWVAYTDGQVLKKIAVNGGQPVVIAKIGDGTPAGGAWAPEGIVLARADGLFSIRSEGDTAERLALDLEPSEQVIDPEILPGGRAVLFTVIPTRTIQLNRVGSAPGARIEVLEIDSGIRKTLIREAGRARYVSTGHLIYVAGERLHVVGFDLTTLQVRGNPVAIVTDPASTEFDVSDEGTFVYAVGNRARGSTLVWVNHHGQEEALGTPPRRYIYPRLSPDGTRVALDVDGPDRDIWMWDIRRRALERFTVDSTGNPLVAWSPDGQRVAFGSFRFGTSNLFLQAANGSGEPERLLVSDRLQMPLSFAPDGRVLFSEEVPGQGRNIHALSLGNTRRVEPLIVGAADELNAEVSPDGKWIAYDSNESGQFEIYVRPYPNVKDGRWKISVEGGRQPLWSRVGRQLFYRDFTGAVMAASIALAPTFAPGAVIKLLDAAEYAGGGAFGGGRTYDVSLDGSRFLLIKPIQADDIPSPSIVVVLNWFEELTRLAPTLPPI